MTFHVGAEELAEETHVVAVDGELDLYTAPDLEQALLNVLASGGRRIVVDLALTTFIDSVALGVLVRTAQQLRRQGGRLGIACPGDVARFFEVAGLDRVLAIWPNRADAMAGISMSGGGR